MLSGTQSKQHPLPSNDNSPLFYTQEFRSFIGHLEYKNSLSALLRFVSSTSGVNAAIRAAPYVYALHSNLKLTREVIEIISYSRHGDHVKVWGAEVFMRILSQIPEEQRSALRVSVRALADHFSTKLQESFKKDEICDVYNREYIEYLNKVLQHYSRHRTENHVFIDKDTIADAARSILDDMVKHFALADNRKFCLLLTFFGANFDTNGALSSEVLREILLYGSPAACVPNNNISIEESTCRDKITTALHTAINTIRNRIEETESFVYKSHSWYKIFTKIKQAYQYYITLPRLSHMFDVVRRLDTNYKTSISLGDCSEFFASLEEVKPAKGNTKSECMQRLFLSLEEAHSSYKLTPHHKHVADVRNCRVNQGTVPIQSIKPSFIGKLKQVRRKICSYFTRKKTPPQLTKAHKRKSRSRTYCNRYSKEVVYNSSSELDELGTYNDICAERANSDSPLPSSSRYPVRYSIHKKHTTWRKHLLKKAGKLIKPHCISPASRSSMKRRASSRTSIYLPSGALRASTSAHYASFLELAVKSRHRSVSCISFEEGLTVFPSEEQDNFSSSALDPLSTSSLQSEHKQSASNPAGKKKSKLKVLLKKTKKYLRKNVFHHQSDNELANDIHRIDGVSGYDQRVAEATGSPVQSPHYALQTHDEFPPLGPTHHKTRASKTK